MRANSSLSSVPFGAFVHVSEAPWLQGSLTEKDRQVKTILKQLAINDLPMYGADALNAYCWVVSEDGSEGLLAVNEPNGNQDANWLRKLAWQQEWNSLEQFLAKKFFKTDVYKTNKELIDFFKTQQAKAEHTQTPLRWQSVTDAAQVPPLMLQA